MWHSTWHVGSSQEHTDPEGSVLQGTYRVTTARGHMSAREEGQCSEWPRPRSIHLLLLKMLVPPAAVPYPCGFTAQSSRGQCSRAHPALGESIFGCSENGQFEWDWLLREGTEGRIWRGQSDGSSGLELRAHLPQRTWSKRNWLACSVQLLSHVQLFVMTWTAACQASLSITNCWSLFKLLSIELVMPTNHLIFCRTLLF